MKKKILDLVKNLANPLPTPKQMKKFAGQYSKENWAIISEDTEFLEIFTQDIKKSKIIADKILSKIEKSPSKA